MALTERRLMGAIASQILGQAVAAWGLLAHVVDWQNASIWVAAPLVAAIVVPFRHNGSLRDRATGNFGAGVVIAGQLMWELALGSLPGAPGSGGGFGLVATLMLVSTVLFCMAGAFFWLLRDADRN